MNWISFEEVKTKKPYRFTAKDIELIKTILKNEYLFSDYLDILFQHPKENSMYQGPWVGEKKWTRFHRIVGEQVRFPSGQEKSTQFLLRVGTSSDLAPRVIFEWTLHLEYSDKNELILVLNRKIERVFQFVKPLIVKAKVGKKIPSEIKVGSGCPEMDRDHWAAHEYLVDEKQNKEGE